MGMFAAMEGVCDTPLHIYRLFVRDSLFVGVVPFCFSLATVGAYRIRPDVSEDENNSGKGICNEASLCARLFC